MQHDAVLQQHHEVEVAEYIGACIHKVSPYVKHIISLLCPEEM